jgi:hypothetical protein
MPRKLRLLFTASVALTSPFFVALRTEARTNPETRIDPPHDSQAHRTVVSANLPRRNYPIAPTIIVDYTDDIGTLGRRTGRWSGPIPNTHTLV